MIGKYNYVVAQFYACYYYYYYYFLDVFYLDNSATHLICMTQATRYKSKRVQGYNVN